jgi:hypothetical protein
MIRHNWYRQILIGALTAAVLLPLPGTVLAEPGNRVSWSAENEAIQRAVAAMHPERQGRWENF